MPQMPKPVKPYCIIQRYTRLANDGFDRFTASSVGYCGLQPAEDATAARIRQEKT